MMVKSDKVKLIGAKLKLADNVEAFNYGGAKYFEFLLPLKNHVALHLEFHRVQDAIKNVLF